MKSLKLSTALYFTGQGKSHFYWMTSNSHQTVYWCIKFSDQVYNQLWVSICLKLSTTCQGMVGDNMRVDIKFITNSQCKNYNHSYEAPSVSIRENRCGRIGAYTWINPSISITWHIFGLLRLLVWPP